MIDNTQPNIPPAHTMPAKVQLTAVTPTGGADASPAVFDLGACSVSMSLGGSIAPMQTPEKPGSNDV